MTRAAPLCLLAPLVWGPVLLACGSDTGPRTPVRDGAAMGRDGGSASEPFMGSCGAQTCTASPLGTPGCCTQPGTGVSGDPLEITGRSPGLCGTDVGALIPSLSGTCVQLDQPGAIDSECPAVAPLRGGARMPGCCTDEGYCGALETAVGFGCFYATGRKGRACTPDDSDAGSEVGGRR
jgi:hypothetical protein